MKKLIVGLGLVALTMPAMQAVAKSHVSTDDLRTKRANLQKPIVRVKHQTVTVEPCQCQIPTGRQQRQRVSAPQATGWQRTAKVVPHMPQSSARQFSRAIVKTAPENLQTAYTHIMIPPASGFDV